MGDRLGISSVAGSFCPLPRHGIREASHFQICPENIFASEKNSSTGVSWKLFSEEKSQWTCIFDSHNIFPFPSLPLIIPAPTSRVLWTHVNSHLWGGRSRSLSIACRGAMPVQNSIRNAVVLVQGKTFVSPSSLSRGLRPDPILGTATQQNQNIVPHTQQTKQCEMQWSWLREKPLCYLTKQKQNLLHMQQKSQWWSCHGFGKSVCVPSASRRRVLSGVMERFPPAAPPGTRWWVHRRGPGGEGGHGQRCVGYADGNGGSRI